MSEWLTKVIDDSEARAENRFAKLIRLLLNQGRAEDISKAADDPEYRDVLYKEFQIA